MSGQEREAGRREERDSGGGQGPVLAAGGVLWRHAAPRGTASGPAPPGLEIALVHRPKYDDWSLPKGKLDPGEHLLEAAVREIEEETGAQAVLGRPLGVSSYRVRSTGAAGSAGSADGWRDKVVHYWAAYAESGQFRPHAEIDDLVWLAPPHAAERLSREEDRPLLDAFLAGPAATTPLLVLRHGLALPRKRWRGDDDERPLTQAGEAQALALTGMLAAYGIRSVVSSPSLRCVATVAPYADKAGLPIEPEPALTEPASERDSVAAASVVVDRLGAGTPTVVCAHRTTVPSLLTALANAAGTPVSRQMLRKGELVAAHCADGRVIAVERHLP